MESSPTTPLRPDVNTSRLLRLLRPYTSNLSHLARSITADTDHSAYAVIPQGISLTIGRTAKPDTKRTYGKGSRKPSSARSVYSSQGPTATSLPLEDVFIESSSSSSRGNGDAQYPQALKSNIGLSRYAAARNEQTSKISQQATSVISSFRRLCEVAKPTYGKAKSKSSATRDSKKQRSVPKLSTICATIIGHNLEGYVKAEWLAREREMAGLRSDDSGLQMDSEEEDDMEQEYQDQSWRIERLQEWYDALPGHVVGTVLVEQAVSLALSLPYHPVRTDLLWTLLETVCEQDATSNLRPLLITIIEDILTHDYRKTPLILAGFGAIISPRIIPIEVESAIIPHLSNRRKFLAMCVDPTAASIHCKLAAAMVASGLDFTYNTADQRQIDELDGYTAQWISLWTESICSAKVEEQTGAWCTLYRCLTEIGFLADPLPIDNSPNVYLATFVIAMLDTNRQTRAEKAYLRKALRCLRSNPGIEFDILHPAAVCELTARLLREPEWKTDCPHFTRWFLAHGLRRGSVDQYQQTQTISEWIRELEANMSEVEEHDIDTKNAYAKLGYIWDTTFDSWIKQTPNDKTGNRFSGICDVSVTDVNSSPGAVQDSEDPSLYHGDRSSPTIYRPSSPPTPVVRQDSHAISSPAVKIHTFSSPFMNSPAVKSTVTPKHILKNRHLAVRTSIAQSAFVTPLQPTRKVQPSTVESIDPLDDIEELDKTTPVLPKRVTIRVEATDLASSDDPQSEQDENDPLADHFSDAHLGSPWMFNDAISHTARTDKRKATGAPFTAPAGPSKRQHLR